MNNNLKIGDMVKIIRNDVQPNYIGCVAKVVKVYPSFNPKIGYSTVYRVNYKGKLLKGVAMRGDLEFINENKR